mgnify:FL=1
METRFDLERDLAKLRDELYSRRIALINQQGIVSEDEAEYEAAERDAVAMIEQGWEMKDPERALVVLSRLASTRRKLAVSRSALRARINEIVWRETEIQEHIAKAVNAIDVARLVFDKKEPQ